MAAKFLNLLALSSLLALLSSFGPTPVNALSIDTSPNIARSLGHAAIAKNRRAPNARRCKPRPSSSSVTPSSTPPAAPRTTVQPAVTPPSPTPTPPSPTPDSPPPPVNNGGGGNGKVGLAWPNGDSASIKSWKTNRVKYYYSWSIYPVSGAAAAGFEFIPMLWGRQNVAQFKAATQAAGFAKTALGFNEPDHPGQAEMDPWAAAGIWKDAMQPLKGKGYRLGSPAVASSSQGQQWFRNFMQACDTCTIDFIAVHWYGNSASDFIAYVQKWYADYKKPIWVTEFACQNFSGGAQCSEAQIRDFMSKTTQWMNDTPYVEQYFWFGAMYDMGNVNRDNQIMGGNGQPNALGWQYIG